MNAQPRLRPKVVLKAVSGIVGAAAVAFLILLLMAIGPQKPTRVEAVEFLNFVANVDQLRSWANQQFIDAKTKLPNELEAPAGVLKDTANSAGFMGTFSYSRSTAEDEARISAVFFSGRGDTRLILAYPANSTANHSDKTTFLIANQIYVRITRRMGE